ncbi:N-acetylmuramic acid 6-phosphate etherase [Dactylosporangium matsuzakiense]|uniref:N-acetylmuramic acid 6-phosphate etherase n=1 Tax=Dactylosporangium matsuzakiense TaxID=53360 RepID=A0A9W6KDH9_9ACTN|nr:N-acetylmuramic acid 6-phosphate etherase [Dactylosporangium matsuzakiense]UWZ47278.1 N-acetylmuramic acid 6-phosphate etherase [Dactylosporangium matsuzakiense]GLK98265.1 N-acetylmuramic acid 6-phosphate etherase [Dactylosporangium matsuzakiense]
MSLSPTERRNPATTEIDRLPTLDVLRLINTEDHKVAPAVLAVLPAVAEAVDLAVAALRAGHRMHYFGAGTSGRLAVLDAAELQPTYGAGAGLVAAHIAGGPPALLTAAEGAEDDEALGAAAAVAVRPGDVAVGASASGTTPYVAGALSAARTAGAATVLISANPSAPLAGLADVHIAVDTGPEAITGSTRMKAGTAQKLVLNALSTAVMVRLGRTYSNLMTDMVASNTKLRARQVRLLTQATGLDEQACTAALAAADGEPKVALVALLGQASPAAARRALARTSGIVHAALTALRDA